ncbi:MAG: DUF2569 domain-containing protein [Zoogloeaceae bacterium]|jgi:hypothetical protein|nr:DUF2569 domain-containing protein [Zoogloeaceae bacterium]
MAEEKNLEGLGGWLVLVGIGIVLSPLRIIVDNILPYYSILSDGTWDLLTTPGSEAYHPLWAPLLIGESLINGGLVLACIFTAYLFFSKKKHFPMCYIGVHLFSLAFLLIDAVAVTATVRPDIPVFDEETRKELARSLVSFLIWCPYMLVSKRVKATFVR